MKTFNTYEEAIDYSVINPSETVEYKDYHKNGQLSYHCFFVDGLKHGEFKLYWTDGQLSYHCFYVDGKVHGEYKSYQYDGQLCQHSFYVNGETFDVDHLIDGSYKSLCIKHTLFNGNLCNEDI